VVKIGQIWSAEKATHIDTSLTHMLGGEQNQPKMTRLRTFEKKVQIKLLKSIYIYIFAKFFQRKSLNIYFLSLMYHILSPYNVWNENDNKCAFIWKDIML
jgi:hypothetical protein